MRAGACWLFFDIFASPKRLEIINILREKSHSVGEICDAAEIEQSHVSHELRAMARCRVVESKRDGRNKIYRLSPGIKPILSAADRHVKKHCKRKCADIKEKRRK